MQPAYGWTIPRNQLIIASALNSKSTSRALNAATRSMDITGYYGIEILSTKENMNKDSFEAEHGIPEDDGCVVADIICLCTREIQRLLFLTSTITHSNPIIK